MRYRVEWYYATIDRWQAECEWSFLFYASAVRFVARKVREKGTCREWRVVRVKDGQEMLRLTKGLDHLGRPYPDPDEISDPPRKSLKVSVIPRVH